MANQHIFNNTLIITGSVTASQGFYGDGSGLTGITAVAEWDGSRNGDASITGSLTVSGSSVNVDFVNTTGVSGSFSGSFEGSHSGNGSGLTNLNLNGYQASGSTLSGSFSGSFEGDGSGLTGLGSFPFTGSAEITGSLTITGSITVSGSVVDFTNTTAISGSIFSGSFIGDGSGLTNLPDTEWDGSRNGDAEITGSFIVSGSTPTIELLGDTTIDQNIEISNRNQFDDIAIGYQALPDTTYSGMGGATRRAIAIGYQAATNLVSGSQNIYLGQCAGYSNVKGLNNIGIGFCALACNTGYDAGFDYNFANNLAIGSNALKELTTGNYNFAIGADSSCNMTTGTTNTTVGHISGCRITNGYQNTLLGYGSGIRITNGNRNTFLGDSSGKCATGNENTAVGGFALQQSTGDKNVAIGYQTATYVEGDSSKNIYIGHCAGPSTGVVQNCQLYIGLDKGETPLIRGDFGTGQLTIHSQVSASIFSGSFVGDGSGLTGISGAGFPYDGAAIVSGSLLVSQSTAAGTAVTVENGHTILAQVSESLNYNNDTEAAAGGVPLGGLYRSGNFIAIRLT